MSIETEREAERQREAGASRRHFLIGAGVVGAGTLAGIYVVPQWLARRDAAAADASGAAAAPGAPPVEFRPHAFVRVSSDGAITVIVGKSEMGQGIHTGLAMIVAEQLDVAPSRLRVENAPVDAAFNHPNLNIQMTGGSNSTVTTFEAASRAGATARAMLVAAAAQGWGVEAATLRTDDGVVTDGRRKASYAALAAAAATQPVPKDVPLKARADYKYLGKAQSRLDGPAKVNGSAVFGIDVERPDMLYAMVARSPVFGGKVASFDAAAARAIPGVVDVRQVPTGVAVLATNNWAARRGRDALEIRWNEGAGAQISTAGLRAQWRRLAQQPATMVGKVAGTPEAALAAATKTFDVEYELPYLAHACMEPMNATALVTADRCEIWAPTQNQTLDRAAAAQALGFEPGQVELHTTFLGGGFGRRASTGSDFVVEAVEVARGVGRPVKTTWTREDDMQGGFYRPFSLNRVRGGVDADGRVVAFWHTSVGKPVMTNSPFGGFAKQMGFDPTSVEGSADMPYAIPNLRVDMHATDEGVPILWWRSVGHSINGFVVNSAIDELAALGGRDPLELRRELLAGKPRHLAVLQKAAELGSWGRPLPAGRGRGIALHESFGSIVAEVVEASVQGTEVTVHHVSCAVDCGFAINPDQVVAQMQSGVIFGLSAALRGEITLENGRVQQSNFGDYPVMRIGETPRIDVAILNSDGPLGGIGEPGTPPAAPALTGAIFAATGRRIRRLPVSAALPGA
jgi:isoquinoline 1-oxidoreductase beta subunit